MQLMDQIHHPRSHMNNIFTAISVVSVVGPNTTGHSSKSNLAKVQIAQRSTAVNSTPSLRPFSFHLLHWKPQITLTACPIL